MKDDKMFSVAVGVTMGLSILLALATPVFVIWVVVKLMQHFGVV